MFRSKLFLTNFEKSCFSDFVKIMVKSRKNAITFFPKIGFFWILDMLFIDASARYGVKTGYTFFFPTSKPIFTRLNHLRKKGILVLSHGTSKILSVDVVGVYALNF